jgi:hypothetical protein
MEIKEQRQGPGCPPGDLNAKGESSDSNHPDALLSRRRALLIGLASAPAVLTLVRRPVWAQTRIASAGICASLNAASSLHVGENQLATDCAELQRPTAPAP